MNLKEYCKNRNCLNCKIQKTIYSDIGSLNETTKHKIQDIIGNTVTICNCYKENNVEGKYDEKLEDLTNTCRKRLLFILLNQTSFDKTEEGNTKDNFFFIDSMIQKRSYFKNI